ncbi:MAG: divergent polysaccharide deacetylase family protein, partial [Campylobacteraceae bacterium]|nr:divergent polysaccharide deacetylase family protein [Campylobacteraceae bacterium]
MRKPKKYTKKRARSSSRVKITKLHIIVMIALLLAVFIGLVSSLVYIFIDQKPQAPIVISNVTTPHSGNDTIIGTTNATNATDTNVTANITLGNLSNVIKVPNATMPHKTKLVIIIDDVVNAHQVKKISSIPLKLTPSFLPPKKDTPYSPKLARNTEFYMVHLPTEALNFSAEPITLLTSDSYDDILKKLSKFKKDFPRAIYYNNHTGSKFTADLEAMKKLFRAMDALGLVFVDSRTTAETKAPDVAARLGKRLLQRD